MAAIEPATSKASKTDAGASRRPRLSVALTFAPSSMVAKPLETASIVLRQVIPSFLSRMKTARFRRVAFRYDSGDLGSGTVQSIDRLEQTPHSDSSSSPSAVQALLGYEQANPLGSGAGQEGFEPVEEGLEVELSESPDHGEADEGRQAVSDSATKKDSQSESGTSESINRLDGKIDNRFDRLDSKIDSHTNRLDSKIDNSFNVLLTEVRELGRKFDNYVSAKDREERENSKDKRKEEREDESGRIDFWRSLGIAVVGGIVVVIGDYIKDNGFPGFN